MWKCIIIATLINCKEKSWETVAERESVIYVMKLGLSGEGMQNFG